MGVSHVPKWQYLLISKTILKGKKVLEVCTFFKKEILKVQQPIVLGCHEMSWQGRRAWLNREIFLRLWFGEKKKKKDLTTFGRRGKQLKKNTRILLGYVERKSKKNPKPQLELNLTKIVERFTHALEAERLRWIFVHMLLGEARVVIAFKLYGILMNENSLIVSD